MQPLLEMRDVTKTFPGVKALDRVNLRVQEGEIHALVAENGARKSTLMKLLSGVYTAGEYDGEMAKFHSITDSEAKGVIIIHQELAMIPLLSIAKNLFMDNEIAGRSSVMNWHETLQQALVLLDKVGLRDAPTTIVEKLGVCKQQLVEIAKALTKDVRLFILDEPTAALSKSDSQALLDLMLELKQRGVTQIIISHKLNEIRRVADSVTVIRDGSTVAIMDARTTEISADQIIRDMVGETCRIATLPAHAALAPS